ncbi:MAG: hypothetical protein HUJ86_04815 [Synergistes sp.]|nr:hypothetical protein [Synergistes sp.]
MGDLYEKIKKVRRFFSDKEYRVIILCNKGLYNNLSDEEFIKKRFKETLQRDLDLENPLTFNEKLQWLKLYYHNPLYTTLVDKYRVREVIKEKIGEQYLIPLLGVWEDPEDIDFSSLPEKFVLKCNHNSGLGMCICKDKSHLDIPKVKKKLRAGLKQDWYLCTREWVYKNVSRRVIAEKYMEDSNGELNDYKFFCFDGKADNVMIVAGRSKGTPLFYHYDKNWNLCQFNRLCRSLPKDYKIPKPDNINEMFEIAEYLSRGMPHVRVDLYNVDGKIYFGEYTFFNQSGLETGFDEYSDGYLGSLITLPERV